MNSDQPTDSNPAIVTDGLTKQYADETAVTDLTLSVPNGDIYGFLGPNGAGKTTTMRMLTTLTQPTAGTAAVAGISITDRPALTEQIGYLPASPPVFDELSGWEQLRHVARLHGLSDETADERIEPFLSRFDLLDYADRRISEYSTGMKKKVGIIATVLHDPAVVLLDEPTSGLDPRAARSVRNTIAELVTQDMTVFLSSHILSVVDELADTVGVISEGILVAEGSPDELKARVEDETARGLESAFLEITAEPSGTAGDHGSIPNSQERIEPTSDNRNDVIGE
jgi:ABC-2 type transport system ATP-binding protein